MSGGNNPGNVGIPPQYAQNNNQAPPPPPQPPQKNAVAHLLDNGVDPDVVALLGSDINSDIAAMLTGNGAQWGLSLFPPSPAQEAAANAAAAAAGPAGSPEANAAAAAAKAAAAPSLAGIDSSVAAMFAFLSVGNGAPNHPIWSGKGSSGLGGGPLIGLYGGGASDGNNNTGGVPRGRPLRARELAQGDDDDDWEPAAPGNQFPKFINVQLPEEYAKYIPVAEGNMNQAEVANLIKSNKAKGDLKQVLKGPLRPRVGKNDLKRNDPRRQPQNFEEQYRAGNWRFREFREKGEVGLHTTEFGINRTKWERIPFPMVGDADPRTSKWGQGRPQQYVRPRRQPNRLLDDSPGDERLERVRRRFRSANRFFQKKGKMEMVRPLGWGGLGLTIQYRYTNIEPAMNLVLKIALEGWDDQSLQAEEEMTRQVSRAAHCIQAIPPEKIGMRPKEPFRFKALNFADSSDEGKSSGEESRGEEPKKKRKTRRQMILEDTQQMRIKRQAQQDRAVRWQHRWDERKRRLEAREKRWAAQAAKGQPRTRNDREDREWQLDNRDFLLLEFAEHGDLANFIYKCNELNEMVPNRVLWSFWLCLVSACVAMEYPPRKFHPLRHDPNPPETKGLPTMGFTNFNGENRGKRLGNDLFEDVPHPSRRWAGRGQVHFDIDPQNVLIFGTDPTTLDDEHKTIPRLKLTDFGVASRIKRNKSNLYYWCQRSTGKTDYLAPEQFGPDWEHVAVRTRSGPEISEQPVAGNYGSHTNVWGIALTLWQLMTRLCVPFPPQPSSDPKEPVSYCRVINSRADLAYIDQDLKNTINQCMMHRPGDRPSLLTLMNQAKEGITRRYEGESDRRISAWVSRILNDAPTS